MEQIIIQGIGLSDFLEKAEQASYNGQKRALDEEKENDSAIDWDLFKSNLSVSEIAEIFSVKRTTVRRWIKSREKFGDFMVYGKAIYVPKLQVYKYYLKSIKSTKR